jgi:hypothetical protein
MWRCLLPCPRGSSHFPGVPSSSGFGSAHLSRSRRPAGSTPSPTVRERRKKSLGFCFLGARPISDHDAAAGSRQAGRKSLRYKDRGHATPTRGDRQKEAWTRDARETARVLVAWRGVAREHTTSSARAPSCKVSSPSPAYRISYLSNGRRLHSLAAWAGRRTGTLSASRPDRAAARSLGRRRRDGLRVVQAVQQERAGARGCGRAGVPDLM